LVVGKNIALCALRWDVTAEEVCVIAVDIDALLGGSQAANVVTRRSITVVLVPLDVRARAER